MKRIKLKESDVTFSVEVEPEDMSVRGHFDDKELEDQIVAAQKVGSLEAWCCIVVTAGWTAPDGTEYYGRDSLGGCSFLDGVHEPIKSQIASCIDDHGMRAEALDDLQREVDAAYERQRPVKLRSDGARQATKTDLVDIGRELGVNVHDGMTVDLLRVAIQEQLTHLKQQGRITPLR